MVLFNFLLLHRYVELELISYTSSDAGNHKTAQRGKLDTIKFKTINEIKFTFRLGILNQKVYATRWISNVFLDFGKRNCPRLFKSKVSDLLITFPRFPQTLKRFSLKSASSLVSIC